MFCPPKKEVSVTYGIIQVKVNSFLKLMESTSHFDGAHRFTYICEDNKALECLIYPY